jgi:hypothetical protein
MGTEIRVARIIFTMKNFLRSFGAILLLLALTTLGYLLLFAVWHGFQPDLRHWQAEALSLMVVGAACICLQLSAEVGAGEMLKGVLLGIAFLFWGGERFLPPGPTAEAMDGVVTMIFVVDLGLVIKSSLGRKSVPSSSDQQPLALSPLQ